MTPPKLTFLLSFVSLLALCWLVVLRTVPLDWLTGLFVFVLLLMLAATSERVSPRK